jgi:hypothetical protein
MHAQPNANERRDKAENRGANKQCRAEAARARGWRWWPWLGDDAGHRCASAASASASASASAAARRVL